MAYASSMNSRRSPGWQSSSLHSAASVEKRMAFAFPVLRFDRLAKVMPTREESSVSDMRRSRITVSRFTTIRMAITHTVRSFSALMAAAFSVRCESMNALTPSPPLITTTTSMTASRPSERIPKRAIIAMEAPKNADSARA